MCCFLILNLFEPLQLGLPLEEYFCLFHREYKVGLGCKKKKFIMNWSMQLNKRIYNLIEAEAVNVFHWFELTHSSYFSCHKKSVWLMEWVECSFLLTMFTVTKEA